MKRATFFGAFAALLSAGSAHAVQAVALADTCMAGGMTHMCSKAWTSLNAFEALLYTNGEIQVRGVFDGPGYHAELEASRTPFFLFPSTWQVRVEMQPVCAWSGVSSAEGVHRALGSEKETGIDGLEVPFPFWFGESLWFHTQHYCDCNSEMP